MILTRLGRAPVIEPGFWQLPFPERMAIIAHEAGHRYHGHLWARLWRVWFMRYDALQAFYHQQEFEADQFARSMGYGAQLAAFLKRRIDPPSLHHPATKARVASLIRL